MKKIIAFALMLVLAFMLVACTPTAASQTLSSFNSAIANSSPKSVVIETSFNHTGFDVEMTGEYTITFNEDGTADVGYWYYKLNDADDDNDELLVLVDNKTAHIAADGTVTGDLDKTVTAAAKCRINLDASKMEYSIDRGILTASVKAADTEAVFGVALGFNATLDMRIVDNAIASYSIRYTTSEGTAVIVCNYSN